MAIGIGTALGIGASLVGGAMAKSGAKSAANAQAASAQQGIAAEKEGLAAQLEFQREALAQEKQMFEKSLTLGQPYRNAGERALAQYEQLLYGYTPQPAGGTAAGAGAGSTAGGAGGASGTYDVDKYLQAIDAYNTKKSSGVAGNIPAAGIETPWGRVGADYAGNLNWRGRGAQQDNAMEKLSWAKQWVGGMTGESGTAPKLEDFKLSASGADAAGGAAGAGGTQNLGSPGVEGGQLMGNEDLDAARMAALVKSPGYQFQLDEGEKALERSAAARSGLLTGAAGKAMTRFGQGLASTSYNSFMDRIAGLSGQGAAAAGAGANAAMQAGAQQAGILANMGNASQASAGNIGSLYSQQGAAKASGYLGQASAMNSGFNNVAGMLGQYGGGNTGGAYNGGFGNYGDLGRIDWFA